MPRFGSAVDLQRIPIRNLVPHSGSTAPGTPVEGQLWHDTSVTPARLRVLENGAWVLVSQTGVELLANKGIASGYASLDGNVKVPIAQLPATINSTLATEVVRADDPRMTNSRAPSGTAGGDLTGSYPSPTIGSGAVTDTKVAAANKDGATTTPSMRTLGTGAQQAMPGNYRLDQLAVPTAAVNLNSQKITNLAAPTADTDAATKAYVDAARSGLDVKDSVRVATTPTPGNITLSGTQTIDGITVAAGDRVLVKDQTTASANGIYVVATGAWSRATDADASAEVTPGMFTFVESGTANADSGWVLSTDGPITLGTTALSFVQFSGAGQISAGAGLTKTGNTLDVVAADGSITVNANDITVGNVSIAKGGTGATTAVGARTNLGAVGKYADNVQALTAGTEATIPHGLNSTDVLVQFRRTADGFEEFMDWRIVDANTIGVTASVAYAAAALRVVVIG